MKHKINKFILLFSILISILSIKPSIFIPKALENNGISYTSEIVMEKDTGRVLYENNGYCKRFMASTTKILTAICIIENMDINQKIIVSKETVGIEGSSIYLEEGEVLSVKDLLYGLMLRSGNDCAETLAVACSKTIDNFAVLMNETAKKIGANASNFVNPHGLHNDNHYTTAYDLALISCYSLKNDTFREIVSTKSIEIPWTTRNYNRKLTNKNKMLSNFDGATGIKTGFTKKAGRCLVTSAKRNGMELVSVVLNCPSMWEKSASILNNCFNEYKNVKILDKNNILDFYNYNNKEYGVYIKNDVILPIKESEKNDIRIDVNYTKDLKLPIKKDTAIGNVCIYLKNNLIFTQKIYNIIDIK